MVGGATVAAEFEIDKPIFRTKVAREHDLYKYIAMRVRAEPNDPERAACTGRRDAGKFAAAAPRSYHGRRRRRAVRTSVRTKYILKSR